MTIGRAGRSSLSRRSRDSDRRPPRRGRASATRARFGRGARQSPGAECSARPGPAWPGWRRVPPAGTRSAAGRAAAVAAPGRLAYLPLLRRRIRPASSPRRRIGCTSLRSTSSPTPATSWSSCCRTGPTAAARMTAGLGAGEFGPTSGPYGAPPDDTGEAIGLPPAGLTITFGFGPTLFRTGGKDRFGLAGRQPAALQRLPHFPADKLDPRPVRRRPVHPGLRRRPAGRGARRPQPGPDRLRPGGDALVPARLRPYVVDVDQPDHGRATCSGSRTAR